MTELEQPGMNSFQQHPKLTMPLIKTNLHKQKEVGLFPSSSKRFSVSLYNSTGAPSLLNTSTSTGPQPMKQDFGVKETDSRGTAMRIRPSTPKLNLLAIKKKKTPARLPAQKREK